MCSVNLATPCGWDSVRGQARKGVEGGVKDWSECVRAEGSRAGSACGGVKGGSACGGQGGSVFWGETCTCTIRMTIENNINIKSYTIDFSWIIFL